MFKKRERKSIRRMTKKCKPSLFALSRIPLNWHLVAVPNQSRAFGIPVPYVWDFRPKRLGFLSQTLGNRRDDGFVRMALAMLCRSFTFMGHIAHPEKTVRICFKIINFNSYASFSPLFNCFSVTMGPHCSLKTAENMLKNKL